MGYSLSWLAIKGRAPDAILAELKFQRTGAREEIPESDLCAAVLPSGWYVIVSNQSECVATDAYLARLCDEDAECVTCFIEEHVMVSAASGWKRAGKIWSVTYDCQKAPRHLESSGDLPAAFGTISKDLIDKQRVADENEEGVDYIFSIPVDLAGVLTGFHHDEDIPGAPTDAFEILAGIAPAGVIKRSFWSRLFGR